MSAGKFNNFPPGRYLKGKTAAGCENVQGIINTPQKLACFSQLTH
ncbi:hypothetical protein XSR1_10068 [Xenorhabdus szentirmaii DSM 16338]|uniref:Uncharacterized protein n=1 Tax=Xenorhabdus szentirmaii DSM 16338 TaxID=1427518 RepID=W1IRY1_9GAMM|nr:hypothetical protein XSR1_10068 [Xenorhabdus szentirmaii DSM 16338]